ncbi:MAG: hypothetical protein H6R01_760 [Burkholderiaceae bacterium]|nr:hypothetical protein [Burkholderiaceae bacterium]
MPLDQPLSDQEFDELDQFLLSERCPDGAMTMDSLHGFLTAIVIGPEAIPMSEWLPHVWGDTSKAPAFKSKKEQERILRLILRYMNEIAITFEVAPKEFEPLFCEHDWEGKTLLDGEAWAYGFWLAMSLRVDAWKPIWESEQAPLMRPIYLLGADDIEEEELALVDDPEQCQKLAFEIEANLPLIHRFWQGKRKSGVETVMRAAPKTGRNDPCSCGSGVKFKQCCGAEPQLH